MAGAQNGNGDFRAIDERSEALVVALAGFAKKHRLDRTARAQSFFDETDALNANEAGFGRQSTAQGDAKFLEPAIIAAGDRRRSAGRSRSASGFARRGHSRGSVANFPGHRLI